MSFVVNASTFFRKDLKPLLKKYPSLLEDLAELETSLIGNPTLAEALGKDCYKIRLAIRSKGRGKSGGSRVITYVKIAEGEIFLLAIYDKSEAETISDAEIDYRLKALTKG